ncbi:hypothetical protein Q4567_03505 [Aliiglaciecola sp. 2_MG-2023]|uniref:hypothetical protein n=1 Tax=unclassified Aliiglaciecola TaxID=2593648 RepID=UPI0026E31244|nr:MULTISPECIES: hypothetical protein [unclassified Aliiglaciecola]MDO6709782.1 hypothetical protein [Aliiglaciecola sp. 2_MG-2023]MDO6750676.1 hypothetical protein [Aliiglaciecola sp. 1_MG-2023]
MKLLLILIFISVAFPVKSKDYTVNILDLFKDDIEATHLTQYYTDIYQAVDITPSFTFYPSKRGLKMVNEGILDAEGFRLDVVGEHFSQLIKIDESIGHLQIGFFCLNKNDCIVDESSIVGVLSSFRGAVDFCAESSIECHFIENINSIAKKLDTGLLDAIFATDIEAQKILCASSYDSFQFLPSQVSKLPLYHYVNKRHLSLKQGLEKSIREAKNNGKLAIQFSNHTLTNLSCEKTVTFITP